MKLKNIILFGITSVSFLAFGAFGTSQNASAHTWWDGTPSAVKGYWRTRSVYLKDIGMNNHASIKATSHTITFAYSASSRITLKSTYWRKIGSNSYTIHGAMVQDDNFDHRITVKKIGPYYLHAYFDGHSITRDSVYPNSFFRK